MEKMVVRCGVSWRNEAITLACAVSRLFPNDECNRDLFAVLWAKLRMEEEWMRSQFGETYATYAHQTAALVPYLF